MLTVPGDKVIQEDTSRRRRLLLAPLLATSLHDQPLIAMHEHNHHHDSTYDETRHVSNTPQISRLSHLINPLGGGLPPFTRPMCATLPLEITLLGCIMVQWATYPLGERREKFPSCLVISIVTTWWANALFYLMVNPTKAIWARLCIY